MKYYNTYGVEYDENFFSKEEIERRIKMGVLFTEEIYFNLINKLGTINKS